MRPISDPNWKLPNIPLKKMHPKLHQTSTPLPTIHLHKDVARSDSSLRYLHVKSHLDELEDQLVIKRIRCKQMAKKLVGKWNQLEECEKRLRNLVISHAKFVRENLEKRIRANTRMEQNKQLQLSRQASIDALKKEMDVGQFLMAEFKREIAKHDIYDVFLTKVVENEDSPFKTINDLLSRYELLDYVKEKRVKNQKTESFMVIIVHQNLKDAIQIGKVTLIGLRNELNNLRCQFDDVCRRNLATETLITTIVNRTNELNAEVSSCQYMIDAIYRYICQRRRIPQGDYDLRDVKPKIDVLKSTLGVWAEILASSESKRKKSLRNLRKSHLWKSSLAQGLFMWKRKASMKLSAAPLSENEKKKPSLNKLG
ncbi:coiled-coil domain-containing protein 42-like isoform X2 [Coccinella septempunctata]|uniref:coiled-coil domain-containing protein 42-like isoform X2 n=1 Tax=Coccinella septempunctata TaxID=41139 RepID=UPI001D06C4E1|nr:coiled-coil domain-containing protein 42-like isoform X2 [Coccinella septempunctata]